MIVVGCRDHGTPTPEVPGLETRWVDALCTDPSSLSSVASATAGLVLILHPGDHDLGTVQSAIRETGLDPLGTEIVELPAGADATWIRVMAAAAAARVAAFPGSRPQQAKLRWPELLTRRGFLRLNVPYYVGAPSIDPAACVASVGCRLCIDACPAEALTAAGGTVAYDKQACTACGVCVTACPTGAVVAPTVASRALRAQVTTIVEATEGPVGIELRCRDADAGEQVDGWYPVRVACTGMLTVGWILAPLALGAAAVRATPCASSGCSLAGDERLARHLGAARAVLHAVGIDPSRVSTDTVPLGEPLATTPIDDPFGPLGEAAVVAALATAAGVTDVVVADDGLRLGVVTVDDRTCTACEMCARVCPTGALTSSGADAVELTFDPWSCLGCGRCATVCPEVERGAITVYRRLDLTELWVGRRTVRVAPITTCERCGRPVAPTRMLQRIASMLGPEHADTLERVTRRCVDCR